LNFTFNGAIFLKEVFTFVIVCHCTGMTDRQIRALVRGGNTSKRALTRACPAGLAGLAGTACGGCQVEIERIVRDECRPSENLLRDLTPATA
jgi:bacterioferritin-associated ferredoxin